MSAPEPALLRGLLLAAGAGRRMGRPKALVADEHGPWLSRAVTTLQRGGCAEVTVVLGAQAGDALALLQEHLEAVTGIDAVVAEDWASGQSASLRAGLAALTYTHAQAALVHLVDLPDVGPEVVRRVLDAAGAPTPATLVRASYAGIPGHPVLIGRDHWVPLAGKLSGDQGAKDYLAAHDVRLVECGDLATGADVDQR